MFARKRPKEKAARRGPPFSEEGLVSLDSLATRRALTALFSALPAENLGTSAAGICTFSPGLRGLTPSARLAVG